MGKLMMMGSTLIRAGISIRERHQAIKHTIRSVDVFIDFRFSL